MCEKFHSKSVSGALPCAQRGVIMKRLTVLLTLLGLVLLGSLSTVGVIAAQSFHSGTNVIINQDQPIDATLYAAGSNVTIDTDVNGDVFCAGQTVTINGRVRGDVICAGQTVKINGKVDGDIRVAGQSVTVGAAVTGSLTAAGQSFVLEKSGTITRDATVMANTAELRGKVGRDVVAAATNLLVAGEVGRNISAEVTNLELASTAKVTGDINYTSNNSLVRANGAVVDGVIRQTTPPPTVNTNVDWFGFIVGLYLYWFVAFLIVGMVIALLLPKALHVVSDRALSSPWWPLLVGFVAAVVVPFVFAVLAATFFGLPLAFIIGIAWCLILLLSGSFFAYFIGRIVLRESTNPLPIMLIGIVILMVLYAIPIINVLAFLATVWYGTGMILLELFQRTPKPVYTIENTKLKPKSTV